MKRTRYIASICLLIVLVGAGQALAADCYLNGQRVPEGSRTGPLVCENGKWVERN